MPILPAARPFPVRVRYIGVLPMLALIAVMAAAPTVKADGAWVSSDWSSDFGPIFLAVNVANNEVEGEFPNYTGRLVGTVNLDGTRIDMTWLQPTSDVRCDVALGGTHHWGTVTWTLSPPREMIGQWAYCNGPNVGKWNASLTGGIHPRKALGY